MDHPWWHLHPTTGIPMASPSSATPPCRRPPQGCLLVAGALLGRGVSSLTAHRPHVTRLRRPPSDYTTSARSIASDLVLFLPHAGGRPCAHMATTLSCTLRSGCPLHRCGCLDPSSAAAASPSPASAAATTATYLEREKRCTAALPARRLATWRHSELASNPFPSKLCWQPNKIWNLHVLHFYVKISWASKQ